MTLRESWPSGSEGKLAKNIMILNMSKAKEQVKINFAE